MEKIKKELTLLQKIGEVQQSINKITKNKPGYNDRYKYFDINDLLDALNPQLKTQGLVVIQPITIRETVTGIVRDVLKTIVTDGKDSMEYNMLLPNNLDPQKIGSAITYYRRYSLQSLFCLRAKDDDAESASKATPKKAKTTDDIDLD